MLSEAIKRLKAEYCIRAIEKFKMDKALIFCRTKLDCDNLESYFIKLGGGPKSQDHQFSCNFNKTSSIYIFRVKSLLTLFPFEGVCLHSDRSPNERTENLEKFKQNKVRLLICTDVAARGIDINGLPFGMFQLISISITSTFLFIKARHHFYRFL